MSRTNRRKHPATTTGPPDAAQRAETRQHRALLRRETERIENAPGYANPPPWSLRGVLTLYALMVVINVPVAAVAMRLESQPTFAYSLVTVNVFLYLLYPLLAMPTARRLTGETRLLRPLETISVGALSYFFYVLSTGLAVQVSGHNLDANDAKQLAGVGVAGLIGGAVGAAIYPFAYRRFFMHRLPGNRGPRG